MILPNMASGLRPILDELFLGVLIIDSKGRIVYYNKRMGELDELTPGEALGYRISEVYSVRDDQSPTMRCLMSRRPVTGEYMVYKTARGRQIGSVNHAYPIIEEGELMGAMCLVTDVSSLSKLVIPPLANGAKKNQAEEGVKTAEVNFDDIIGVNPVFREAVDVAKVAALGPSPVMLVGETGTGKDLFAQAIHNYGPRASKRFMAINCSAIPEALLEGVLFGTTRGAFTGAVEKEGLLEHASGGTVFLDEINSMPLMLQAKLLRVIQDHRVRRVGGLSDKKIDLRIISAANISPLKAVADNTLRADLYYRLGVIQVRIPPLRERPEDISHLTQHFIKTVSARLNKNITGLSGGVLASLCRRPWPGNVRELEHTIESALNFVSDGEQLAERHLKRAARHIYMINSEFDSQAKPQMRADNLDSSTARGYSLPSLKADSVLGIFSSEQDGRPKPWASSPTSLPPLRGDMEAVEQERLTAALRQSQGRINRAAAFLGISPQLMSYKMKKYGLKRDMFGGEGGSGHN